jgi:hypothetical protein
MHAQNTHFSATSRPQMQLRLLHVQLAVLPGTRLQQLLQHTAPWEGAAVSSAASSLQALLL